MSITAWVMKVLKKNRKYYLKRFIAQENIVHNMSLDNEKVLKKVYEKARNELEKDLAFFIERYSKENNFSSSDLERMLDTKEKAKFRYSIEGYVKEIEKLGNTKEARELKKELDIMAGRTRISRKQELISTINYELGKAGIKVKNIIGEHLENVAEFVIKDTNKIITGNTLTKLDVKMVERIVNQKWNGKDYSARVWSNRKNLVQKVMKNISTGFIQGHEFKKMSDRLARDMNVGFYEARRLIETETTGALENAKTEIFKELGVEKYQFVATVDDRTSDICLSLDGKIFDMKDRQIGVNCSFMHPFCYDKETEVYTSEGWKLFKDLNRTEKVYTINLENLLPEWQKPINYISYKFNGKLIHYKNKRFDLMITPNHNILVQNMDNTVKDHSWKLKEASSVGRRSQHRMLMGMNWEGQNKEYEILAGKKVNIETYLKFMAYWLADGSCTADRESYNIKIAQNNNDWMYDDLKDFPFKIYKCKESLMIHNKELGEELKQYGKCTEKYIPENIKELNSELIKIFLTAYSKTDGTVKKGKNWKGYQFKDSITFFTTSNKLAGDLGELIMKTGGKPTYQLNKCAGKENKFKNGIYTINNDVWNIRWNTQIHSRLFNMEIIDVPYNDLVYCLEVEKHHTLLARRNGKICWSGNCRSVTIPIVEKVKQDNFSNTVFSQDVKNSIEKEFGKLNTDEVILRNERLKHIKDRHPEVVEILKKDFDKIIKDPNYILKDNKNGDTVWCIKRIEEKNMNMVIKLSISDKKEHSTYLNSVITAHMLDKKRLDKVLIKKQKIYKKH